MEQSKMEEFILTIISNVGTARSCYIEAIQKAKAGAFDESQKLMTEGRSCFAAGHDSHMELLMKSASGEENLLNLIMVHAEDQLMSAEAFEIIAEEFIDLYKNCNMK